MLKLNLGCGGRMENGFLNVDMFFEGADESWDVLDSASYEKFSNHSVNEIRCWHVLEHVHVSRLPAVLEQWNRILTPAGRVDVRVPDILSVMGVCVANGKLCQELLHHVWAFHKHPGDEHHWGYDVQSLKDLFINAKFRVISCIRAQMFELRLEAHKL